MVNSKTFSWNISSVKDNGPHGILTVLYNKFDQQDKVLFKNFKDQENYNNEEQVLAKLSGVRGFST